MHVVLAGVQTDRLAFVADAVYVCGARRLAARGRSWSTAASPAFVGGIVCVWVAVGSGLAAYDAVNATIHMTQHALYVALTLMFDHHLDERMPLSAAVRGR